eukprot:TRINITY_DN24741_c0_g1_i1.p1 TRINITY_DN24741_c0_g1~~TRINITY_DN24741_c0_g1_i1.p1  ORF type:complete len:101 (-),score=38.73 TRINITY_DN24741_c0_g1_i1:75-377(-)
MCIRDSYNGGGMIRALTNEGIIRPYKKFRDTNGDALTYARYVQFQFDYGDEDQMRVLHKVIKEHPDAVSYTHLRAHETPEHLVCRLLLEKKKNKWYESRM